MNIITLEEQLKQLERLLRGGRNDIALVLVKDILSRVKEDQYLPPKLPRGCVRVVK